MTRIDFPDTPMFITKNPMTAVYGLTDGRACGDCAHLTAIRMAKTYYKCGLRGITHGPGTDHRVGWPACGKFVERVEEKISQ